MSFYFLRKSLDVFKGLRFAYFLLEDKWVLWVDSKETKPINPKGNRPSIFSGRTDADAKVPILWPPDEKSQLTGKDSDAGKDWGQEKGETEDERDGLHHWLNEHDLEQAPGDSEGQGSLACCSPWGCRVRHSLATKQQHSPEKDVEVLPISQNLWLWPYLEIGFYRGDNQAKMRSSEWALVPRDCVQIKRESLYTEGDLDRREMVWRRMENPSPNEGMPDTVTHKDRVVQHSPSQPSQGTNLANAWFWSFGLQKCKKLKEL